MSERNIVAIGGGGFSDEGRLTALDDYILGLASSSRPKVCFLPTASGDADGYIVKFYDAFTAALCQPSHMTLFRGWVYVPPSHLLDQDVIYVGGGNTANMLAVWRVQGIDRVLREAWEGGTILCGVSAGALCWFQGGVTDSFGPDMAPLTNGLGLLEGSTCPYYSARRSAYHRFVLEGSLPPGIGVDSHAAVHFNGKSLTKVVSSERNAAAYNVTRDGDTIKETPMDVMYLS